MIIPLFRSSLRHLWHTRLYGVINVLGLASGITCLLLAVLYWKDEHGFDSFHLTNPNLFRMTTTLVEGKGENIRTVGATGQVQGPAFKEAIPEIITYARIMGGDIYSDVMFDDKTLRLQTLFVDESFFDLFTFHLINGNPSTVLKDINNVVITESTARRFFNSTNVVGKLLGMNADPSFKRSGSPLVVSGVVKDPPNNSSLQFDALLTFQFLHLSFEDSNWLNAYLGTFVVLRPNADRKALLQKFQHVFKVHAKEQLAKNFDTYGYEPQITYGLQPMTDVHLHPLTSLTGNAEAGIINGSSPVYSYMFMGIAFFIVLMAGINFINISITNSLKRAKEVAIKKIAGGSRRQIILQFLNESAITCLIAFLFSLALMNILLPLFNNVTGKHIRLSESFDITLMGYFTMVLVIIILFTGLYPAVVLSRFSPSEVLYGKRQLVSRHILGRCLVVIQFSLAVFLLITTIVYHGQMNYIRTKHLGYNAKQVIRTAVSGDRDYPLIVNRIKNEFSKEPSIKKVSFGNDGYIEEISVNGQHFNAQFKKADENFLAVLEIPLETGNDLSAPSSPGTESSVVVNEAFVKAAFLTAPLGTRITINNYEGNKLKTITGVVKDFHFGSLREPIRPMVLYNDGIADGGMWIRFDQQKQKEALAAVERIYKKLMPGAVYQFSFLDELNARQYMQEERWQKVISIATFISMVICCLGLFGLAHLATQQRVKEIGIRKVLGASVTGIVTMLSGNFLKLVIIAFVVAAPVSWMVLDSWLHSFAYRINIGPGTYVLAACIAVIIALVAVSVQAIRSAMENPVKSLKVQ